jgi:hypothetical protein
MKNIAVNNINNQSAIAETIADIYINSGLVGIDFDSDGEPVIVKEENTMNTNIEIIIAAINVIMEEAVSYVGSENGAHYFTPIRSYERDILVVVKEDETYIAHPFGDEKDEDITEEVKHVIKRLTEASETHNHVEAAEMLISTMMEIGAAGFVGVELPQEKVISTILAERLHEMGYGYDDIHTLMKDACWIGEDNLTVGVSEEDIEDIKRTFLDSSYEDWAIQDFLDVLDEQEKISKRRRA